MKLNIQLVKKIKKVETMKAILISVHAKWCSLMIKGDKTVEVRKGTALYKATQKLIDEYGYAEFYVYCTKGKRPLWKDLMCLCGDEKYKYNDKYNLSDIDSAYNEELLNGKVIFKFRCYKVEEIMFFEEYVFPNGYEDYDGEWVDTSETYKNVHDINNGTLQKTCLTYEELQNYLGNKNGCAIHISDLEIFDRPKELWEFDKCILCEDLSHDSMVHIHQRYKITKAPQSFMYIESQDWGELKE